MRYYDCMIVEFKNISSIRKNHPGKKLIFASGSFDLTHAGHVLFLEDAKAQGEILAVMVGGDEVIRHNKGPDRPIVNEHLRLKMIDSLKPVDYTILDTDSHHNPHQLDFLKTVFSEMKPDAYVVNDDGYDLPYRRMLAAEYNVPIIVLPRNAPPEFKTPSTTKIIEKLREIKEEGI